MVIAGAGDGEFAVAGFVPSQSLVRPKRLVANGALIQQFLLRNWRRRRPWRRRRRRCRRPPAAAREHNKAERQILLLSRLTLHAPRPLRSLPGLRPLMIKVAQARRILKLKHRRPRRRRRVQSFKCHINPSSYQEHPERKKEREM